MAAGMRRANPAVVFPLLSDICTCMVANIFRPAGFLWLVASFLQNRFLGRIPIQAFVAGCQGCTDRTRNLEMHADRMEVPLLLGK